MTHLTPYEPGAANPWDRAAAGHLLRRAGFCPSEEEMQRCLADGPRATVERLVGQRDESPRYRELDAVGPALALRDDIHGLRGWWALRLGHTLRPLHGRMALFWHNHFATSNQKVRSAPMMLQQLRTLERYALAPLADLLRAVSRDPAMIVWLDGNENRKGRPNENYARELFELFTLGVGHYSEQDIKESARAFTGWHQQRGQFRLRASEHDGGEKTILGERGAFDGDDVVRIALAQPACPVFLAGKLLREFLCPDPPADCVAALAAELRETGLDLAAALRAFFASQMFFEPRWRRTRIKSPVEFVVGLLRGLELRVGAGPLADALTQMGQALFEPPTVKGWDGHRAWLNSATLLVRMNTAARAVEPGVLDAGALRSKYQLSDKAAVDRFCEDLMFDGAAPGALAGSLDALDQSELDARLRAGLRLLAMSPEYQLA